MLIESNAILYHQVAELMDCDVNDLPEDLVIYLNKISSLRNKLKGKIVEVWSSQILAVIITDYCLTNNIEIE